MAETSVQKNERSIVVGVDIGTTKTACIVGRKNDNGKVEILGYGSVESTGVKRGVVSNIAETVNSISKAVAIASEMSNVDIKLVNVGIAGQHVKSFRHRGSLIRENSEAEITQQELNNLCKSMEKIGVQPGEEIISVIPQDYNIDGEEGIKNPVGMQGNQIEANYHIIVAQKTAANNITRCLNQAGLEQKYMIHEPIASAEAVLGDDEREAGVALVDMGGGTTDIAIIHDHILLHTAVIPFGGNVISDDICEGCSIIRRYAEDIKVRFGSALPEQNRANEFVSIPGIRGREAKRISLKNLSEIIHARLDEIFDLVNIEIKKVNDTHNLVAGIVLTGGGAEMKHIAQYAAFKTGMDVRVGRPNEYLAPEAPEELYSPIYATCVGLVIEGIERCEDDEEINEPLRISAETDETDKTPKTPRERRNPFKIIIELINKTTPDELS